MTQLFLFSPAFTRNGTCFGSKFSATIDGDTATSSGKWPDLSPDCVFVLSADGPAGEVVFLTYQSQTCRFITHITAFRGWEWRFERSIKQNNQTLNLLILYFYIFILLLYTYNHWFKQSVTQPSAVQVKSFWWSGWITSEHTCSVSSLRAKHTGSVSDGQ